MGNRALSGLKNPPPPRRVQSENLIAEGVANPRGIATRDGRPVFSDAQLAGEPEEMIDGLSISKQGDSRPTSTMQMSLGPQGRERVGGAEIVDNQLRPRRKAH